MPVVTHRLTFFIALCLGVWAVGFFPYQFSPHHLYIENGAQFSEQQIRIETPGLIHTENAPVWFDEVLSHSLLDLRFDVKINRSQREALTTIVALGRGRWVRNFAIEQDGEGVLLWVRVDNSIKGQPYFVDKIFVKDAWHHLRLLLDADSLRLWVDGKLVINEVLPPLYMSLWSPNHVLSLGSEVDGDRAWLGELRNVSFKSVDKQYSLADMALLRPDPLIVLAGGHASQWRPFSSQFSLDVGMDWLINIAGFVPIGAVLYLLLGNIIKVSAVAALLSFSVEFGQLFLLVRTTQVDDLILNIGGALIGAGLVVLMVRHYRGSVSSP